MVCIVILKREDQFIVLPNEALTLIWTGNGKCIWGQCRLDTIGLNLSKQDFLLSTVSSIANHASCRNAENKYRFDIMSMTY